MFSDKILKNFREPNNAGDLPGATAMAEVSNPVCGDVMRLAVRVDDGRITDARFKTQGCVASIAAGSVLTRLLVGKTPAEARSIKADELAELLDGLPPASFHAVQLCVDAVAAVTQKTT